MYESKDKITFLITDNVKLSKPCVSNPQLDFEAFEKPSIVYL